LLYIASMRIKCSRCDNSGWVCETHEDKPCPECNPSDAQHPPRLPPDFVPEIEQGLKDLNEAIGDKTNERFDEAVCRQKIIDRLK
jgi:hypothetical protein